MMQNAALLWHVSLLVPPERKGLALGMVGLVRVVPIVVFSMISGVVADAWDRRKLMLFTQIGRDGRRRGAGGADVSRPDARLADLRARGARRRPSARSICPARGALVPTLVPREHLPNAISLNTIMFQTASVVGPSLGGLLIAADQRRLGVRGQRRLVRLRHRRAADDARRPGAPQSEGGSRDDVSLHGGARRAALRLPLAAHPIDDAARFLRDVLLVGDGAAADLRAGHPAGRRARATAGCTRRRRSARW